MPQGDEDEHTRYLNSITDNDDDDDELEDELATADGEPEPQEGEEFDDFYARLEAWQEARRILQPEPGPFQTPEQRIISANRRNLAEDPTFLNDEKSVDLRREFDELQVSTFADHLIWNVPVSKLDTPPWRICRSLFRISLTLRSNTDNSQVS